tara:strand:- start:247 stop:426 length:180 start_codon:yes stop_codon:yes gene_type:complete
MSELERGLLRMVDYCRRNRATTGDVVYDTLVAVYCGLIQDPPLERYALALVRRVVDRME